MSELRGTEPGRGALLHVLRHSAFGRAQGTYRFAITDQAGPDAFAVSVGGVSNSFGVSCRANSDSAYYLLIGTSGRWAIEKLSNNTDFAFLAQGTDLAITSGRATDSDSPIPSGTAGIAVTGQSGLVVEFDTFVLEELAFPSPPPRSTRPPGNRSESAYNRAHGA